MPDLNPVDEIHTQLEQESDLSGEQVDEFKEFVSEYYYEIQYGPDSLSLQSLYAESFQNIVEKSVFFGGSNKIIHGFNSQGKTSFLKALQFNLLGLPNDKQAHQMTNLIRDGQSRLHTRGEWIVDDSSFILDREIVTEGRGGSLQNHDEPTISELSDESVQPPEERDIPRDRQSAV